MSVQSEITRLENAKAAIKSAIEGKGVTVPDTTLLDGMAALIESIEAGGGAMYTGSITPSKTMEAEHIVRHNLGVVPNFAAMYALDDDTSVTDRMYLKARVAFCSDVNDKTTICGGNSYRYEGSTKYSTTSYNVNQYAFTSINYGAGQIVYGATKSQIHFTSFVTSQRFYLQAGTTYNILVAKL